MRIVLPLLCLPRDHIAKNAINEMQRRNGERARAEILRDVAGRLEAEVGGCLSARLFKNQGTDCHEFWCVVQA